MVSGHWLSSVRKQFSMTSSQRSGSRRQVITKHSISVQSFEVLETRSLLSAVTEFGFIEQSGPEQSGSEQYGPELEDEAADDEFKMRVDAAGNEWCELSILDESHFGGCCCGSCIGIVTRRDPSDDGSDSEEARTIAGGTQSGGSSPFPLGDTFLLSSNPTARHTIYLDFNGHVTSGTPWNTSFTGGAPFTTPEYNIDGTAGFSNTELANIQRIWQRVAEDFISFDVNVTTQQPADVNDLIKSGSSDTRWGVRVAIGGSSYDWYGAGAGGVAYLTSFNWNSDTPTYVFTAQLGNGNVKYTAEAVSHEVGHTLGLRHDGTSSQGYYPGHGSGDTGWAPIMGVGYYQNLSQWSKGQYAGANNLEDDLNIITTQNGFGYRPDDYGNSLATAGSATVVNATTVDGAGVIEMNNDFDVFRFSTGAGPITLNVAPFELGPNLDIRADLFDSAGVLLASSNPANLLSASIATSVSAGQYYLAVSSVGKGDPLTTGYTQYGSVGMYSFTGTVVAQDPSPDLTISDASANEGGVLSFTLTLSKTAAIPVTVQFATANGTASAGSDYTSTSGTVTFNPGETSKTITVNSLQDTVYEGNETFTVNLSNPSGLVIADNQAVGTIIEDDPLPLPNIRIADTTVVEGNLITFGPDAGKSQQTPMTFRLTLSAASPLPVSVTFATSNGTATTANRDYVANGGTVVFSPGQITQTITVIVLGDHTFEEDETLRVLLTNPVNATIADSAAIGVIINDDTTVRRDGGGPGGGRVDLWLLGGSTVDDNGTSASFNLLPAREVIRERLSFVSDSPTSQPVVQAELSGLVRIASQSASTRSVDALKGSLETSITVFDSQILTSDGPNTLQFDEVFSDEINSLLDGTQAELPVTSPVIPPTDDVVEEVATEEVVSEEMAAAVASAN